MLVNGNHIGISASNKPLPNTVGVHLFRTDLARIGTSGANVEREMRAYAEVAGL